MKPISACYDDFKFPQHVETWLAGATPLNFFSTERLTESAKVHRSKIAPTFAPTRAAFEKQIGSRKDQLQERSKWQVVVGLNSTLSAFVHDIGRSPYHLTRLALAEAHLLLTERWTRTEIIHEFHTSFFIGLEATFIILIKLGLETPETLLQQIQNGHLAVFTALSRALEAFASRFAPPGTLYLASGKTLSREYCPRAAVGHFDHIHELVNRSPGFLQGFFPDMVAFEKWLPIILKSFKSSSRDISLPVNLWRALRTAQIEMDYQIFWEDECEKAKAIPSRGELSKHMRQDAS